MSLDPKYYTVLMDHAPQVGSIWQSARLNPAPAPDKWWKVMFSPVTLVEGCAVTLQECDPKITTPCPVEPPRAPEPTITDVLREIAALRTEIAVLREDARAQQWPKNGTYTYVPHPSDGEVLTVRGDGP